MTPAGSSGEPGSSSEQAEALQPISHGHKRDGAERPSPAVLVLAGQRQMPAAMPSGPPHLHSAASCLARCVTPPHDTAADERAPFAKPAEVTSTRPALAAPGMLCRGYFLQQNSFTSLVHLPRCKEPS